MAKSGREARKRIGKAPKAKQVTGLEKVLKPGHGFLLATNKGLTVEQITKLRAEGRAKKVGIKVAKNRLLRIALKNLGYDPGPLGSLLKGQTLLFSGVEDPITPAKVLVQATKDTPEKIEIKGGFFEGKVLSAKEVTALSEMPGREALLGRLLGSMMAPAQNTVYALNQAAAKVVYAVDAHRRKLEEGGASSAA